MKHESARSVSENAHILVCGRQLRRNARRCCCKIPIALTDPEGHAGGVLSAIAWLRQQSVFRTLEG
jgi:hypothetical protein